MFFVFLSWDGAAQKEVGLKATKIPVISKKNVIHNAGLLMINETRILNFQLLTEKDERDKICALTTISNILQ